jgi:hypothetical protein
MPCFAPAEGHPALAGLTIVSTFPSPFEGGRLTYLAAGAGALGAGLLLLSRSRSTLLGGLLLLAVAEIALLVGLSAGERLVALASSPLGLAALVGGLAALAVLAALLVHHPMAVAPLAVVAAPLRPPVSFGGDNSAPGFAAFGELGRLLPLYAVLAGAVLALAWRVARRAEVRELPRALTIPVAALVALVPLSVLWSRDPAAGADQLTFFWLPFAALIGTVARAPVDDPRLGRLLGLALVVPAAVFAGVGLYQAAAREVFFSTPGLDAGNAYGSLFRVTSLFHDPSHYGRHLVTAIAVVLAALWMRRARLAPAAVLLALLGAGLYFSYSQSSLVALVTVAVALALVAGQPGTRRLMGAAAAVIVVAGLAVVTFQPAHEDERSVTSGRARRVVDTMAVFDRHPLVGVGVGAQPTASLAAAGGRGDPARYASHTTPLTVAAELGIVGLAAYLALLVGIARTLLTVRARDPAMALGLAAVLLVLFVHSLFYEGFFENPLTWIALGLAGGSAAGGRGLRRAGESPARPEPVANAIPGGGIARPRTAAGG